MISAHRCEWKRCSSPGNARRYRVQVPGAGAEGMEELHFHCLRHHLATLLIDMGCDVKSVQARMRHGSAKTTMDV